MRKKIGSFSIFVLIFVLISTVVLGNSFAAQNEAIVNGTQFKDTSGNVIHAHGGGMIKYKEYYYWYGEYRDGSNYFLGVRCYRSKDLINWELRGEVLSPGSSSELNKCNIERPKVMYNALNDEFVMWMHWEDGVNYGQARAAVAYCKTPDGKFTYQGSFRPLVDTGVTDHGLKGYMSRDCNVFVDTDGKGYFISSSNENMDLHLYELTQDYKKIASLKAKLYVGKQREAPCLIKHNNYYYLITSGCTGWSPNQSKYAYSKSLSTGWSDLYNLGNSTTYKSQPAFIIPIQETQKTTFLYTGDRWAGAWNGKVNDSQYVWLPLEIISDTKLELPYYDSIKIDAITGSISENLTNTTRYKFVNENSGKVLTIKDGSMEAGASVVQWSDNGDASQQWYMVDMGDGYKKIVNAKSNRVLDVNGSSQEDGGTIIQWTSNNGSNQQWKFVSANGYSKIINRNSGMLLDVKKWNTTDGGEIQQWSDVDGANQRWKVVEVGSVTPTIMPTSTPTSSQKPSGLKVSGYINPDFSYSADMAKTVKKGFQVEVIGTGKTAVTNSDGYFEIVDVPVSSDGYSISITKSNYLKRELKGVVVTSNRLISSIDNPLEMCAGDIPIGGARDNIINMSDIMEIAKSFNSTSGTSGFNTYCDLNEDGSINMMDVIVIAKNFNKTSSSYATLLI